MACVDWVLAWFKVSSDTAMTIKKEETWHEPQHKLGYCNIPLRTAVDLSKQYGSSLGHHFNMFSLVPPLFHWFWGASQCWNFKFQFKNFGWDGLSVTQLKEVISHLSSRTRQETWKTAVLSGWCQMCLRVCKWEREGYMNWVKEKNCPGMFGPLQITYPFLGLT